MRALDPRDPLLKAVDRAERDAKDYAIEFGGYLAGAAREFMVAVNSGDQERRDDAWRGLNSAIYEFEKRARRAALAGTR